MLKANDFSFNEAHTILLFLVQIRNSRRKEKDVILPPCPRNSKQLFVRGETG